MFGFQRKRLHDVLLGALIALSASTASAADKGARVESVTFSATPAPTTAADQTRVFTTSVAI